MRNKNLNKRDFAHVLVAIVNKREDTNDTYVDVVDMSIDHRQSPLVMASRFAVST